MHRVVEDGNDVLARRFNDQRTQRRCAFSGRNWCCCSKANGKSIALAALWLLVGVAVFVALAHFKNYQTAAIGGAAWAGLTAIALLGRCCWNKCQKNKMEKDIVPQALTEVPDNTPQQIDNEKARQLLQEVEAKDRDENTFGKLCEITLLYNAHVLFQIFAQEKMARFFKVRLPEGRLTTAEDFANAENYLNFYIKLKTLILNTSKKGWDLGLSNRDKHQWTSVFPVRLAEHGMHARNDIVNQLKTRANSDISIAVDLGVLYQDAYSHDLKDIFYDNGRALTRAELQNEALNRLLKCAEHFATPRPDDVKKENIKKCAKTCLSLGYLGWKINDPKISKDIDEAIVKINLGVKEEEIFRYYQVHSELRRVQKCQKDAQKRLAGANQPALQASV